MLTTVKIIYILIGTMGILGNTLVPVVILSSAGMRTRLTNLYIVNQCTADLLGSLFLILTSVLEEGEGPSGDVYWRDLYCRLWLSKWHLWGLFAVSTYSLLLTTAERYLGVVHAVWHHNNLSPTKALVSMVTVWAMCLTYAGCNMVIPTIFRNGTCLLYHQYAPHGKLASGVFNFSFLYLVPLLVIIICYGHMARVLQQRISTGHVASGNMIHAKHNVIKTLFTVSLGFLACWTCNQIYYFMFNLGYPIDFSSPFYHFTVIAIFMNCCINPVIYVVKYHSFRRALQDLLPCSSPEQKLVNV